MIFTECPTCGFSISVPYQPEQMLRFRRFLCAACNEICFVQMATIGGQTYSKEAFKAAGGNFNEEDLGVCPACVSTECTHYCMKCGYRDCRLSDDCPHRNDAETD